jgi:DNA-binding NarL/FixJ family response regulator
VILDLGLPDTDGFQVMEVVRQAGCDARVLVISANCDDHTVHRVERAGFDGFVDKGAGAFDTLRVAIRALAERRRYFSRRFQKVRSKRRANPLSFDKLLTDREQTVLALVGGLLTDEEIGGRLHISSLTAQKHRFNILHKLGLDSKVKLVRYALGHGFKPLVEGMRSVRKSPGDAPEA